MATPLVSLLIGVGGFLLQMMFQPKPKDQHGPRLSDVNVAAVSPGNPIIRHWGTMKLTSQILWTSRLIETKHVNKAGGGGKGMKPKAPKQITYTYSVDAAFGICQGPVYRVRRIRANQKIIWNNPEIADEIAGDFEAAYYSEGTRLLESDVEYAEAHVGAFFFAFNNFSVNEYVHGTEQEAINYIMSHPLIPGQTPNSAVVNQLVGQMMDPIDKDMKYEKTKIRFDNLQIYLGHEDQQPNPVIESYKGVGNVSGYRGVCYFVVTNLQLEDFGNSIPTFQVEVEKGDGSVVLSDIVNDICIESGLEPSEFSIDGGLGKPEVAGFAITNSSSARSILQDLQRIFPFDGQETSYSLRFGWMENRAKAIVRREDFAAHEQGQEMPPVIETTRASDLELPRQFNLTYQEPTRAFSSNTVIARRMITDGNHVEDIEMAIALSRPLAKSLVESALANVYMGRRTHKAILPRKYVILEAGDAILVPEEDNPNQYYGLLITEVNTGANGVIEFSFVDHHHHEMVDAVTESDIIVDDDQDRTETFGSRTFAYMLDLPLLTDTEEDNVGYYVVMSGTRNGWNGGELVIDISSGGVVEAFGVVEDAENTGANWYTVVDTQEGAPHGFILNRLGPATPGAWDYTNYVRVMLLERDIQLASVAKSELIRNPFNLVVVGNEVLQFADAVDKGNGIWELRTLLRGLRGTDHAIEGHLAGERVVRLLQNSTHRVTHDVAHLNQSGEYRALSFGQSAEEADSFWFTNTGNSLRPYTVSIQEAVKSGDEFYVRWSPRVRQNGLWQNQIVPELDQPFENYEIDVVSPGGIVVRTAAISSEREWTYTDTMQVADFGSVQDSVTLRLYQMGRIIGRGFAKEITING